MEEYAKTKQQRRRSQIRTGIVMVVILGALWFLSKHVELTDLLGLIVFAIGFITVIGGIVLMVSKSDYYQPIKKQKMEEEAALEKRKEEIVELAKEYIAQHQISNAPDLETTKTNRPQQPQVLSRTGIPDLETTNTVVWMAHCINLPFIPLEKNIDINMSMLSMLHDFNDAVKENDKDRITEIYNKFQDKMKEKIDGGMDGFMANLHMDSFKLCAMSKDLLDMYKMVIEGQKNTNVLGGNGSIRRILKYSIELGSPAKTLDTLTDFFVMNTWFDNMPEEKEWLKLSLECMMITGNENLGRIILDRLQNNGGISDDEEEELRNHAREFRSQIDDSWL